MISIELSRRFKQIVRAMDGRRRVAGLCGIRRRVAMPS
jgi:hypothetical protein